MTPVARSGPPPGAEWPPPRHVAVEGVRFAVRRFEPPRRRRTVPVLLLHGVPQTALCWRELARDLARDRTVLAPDLKGLGESEAAGRYDQATLVRELAALVLHEVDGPVDVVGHDWGGVLGIGLSRRRPELVRRLVVVNAPFRYLDVRRAMHVPLFSLPVLPELVFAARGRASLVRSMIRYAWRVPEPLDPDILRAYEDAYASPERIAAMLAYYRAAVRHRLTRPAELASMFTARRPGPAASAGSAGMSPSLVLWGAADPVLPLTVAEAAARDLGPAATLVTVPRAGHFLVEEAPAMAIPVIGRYLRADRAPTAAELV